MNLRLVPILNHDTVRRLVGPFASIKIKGHRVQVSVEAKMTSTMRTYLYHNLPVGTEVYVTGDYPSYRVYLKKLIFKIIGV